MRKGWYASKLCDLIEIQNGYAFSSKDYVESGHFLIRIGNVQSGEIRLSDPKYVGLPASGKLSRFELCEGDILVSLTGYVGRVGVILDEHLPAALNQRVAKITIKQGAPVEREFLLHFLGSDWFRDPLIAAGHGAAQQNVSTKDILEIELSIPPLPEQQRIVAILDEAFDGIATAKANAEKNLQNARALFESHLQSVFTERGEGWVEKQLCEVVTILNGYAFKSGDFSSDGATKSIKITNVGVREFVETSDSGLPADFAEKFASVAAPAGSLVIALTRTIIADGLKVAVVPTAYDRALVNQRVAALLPKPKEVSASYLFAYLSTSIVLNYVKERVNTLMQPNLSINDLRAMPIPLPPASERESIIDRLNTLEDETHRLEALYQRKVDALDELKQSLLYQAFSGNL